MEQIGNVRQIILSLLSLVLVACSSDEGPSSDASTDAEPQHIIKVILPSQPQGLDYLPRSGLPNNDEYRLLELYAETNNSTIEKVYVEGYDQLIPTLLAKRGDIIVNNLTVTDKRKELVNFTSPIGFVHEQLIGRRGDTPKMAHELAGRKVAVHRSDAYYETLKSIQNRRFQPPFEIIEVDESIPTEQIINRVTEMRYDLAVTDSNLLQELPEDSGIEIGFDIGPVRPIAWAVRQDDDTLLASINDFLGRHHLGPNGEFISSGDLDTIKNNQVLRVLTRNNASTYFLWRGELQGFEYDLAKRFAEKHNLRLEMVVPPSRDLLIPWLEEGKGDIIAAAMSNTDDRQQEAISFSRPYNTISEMVVSRRDDAIENVEQLTGRTVVVRPSSSYWQSLKALQQMGINFTLVAAPEELETEELIAQVASGELDLTVADSHILDIELKWRDDIRAAFALQERQHGWVVRKDNPKLLQAIDAFFREEYRSLFYNVTYEKYFKNTRRIQRHLEEHPEIGNNDTLSPYDEMVKRLATQYGLDWRLVVSQMYQESRFNPNARSWVGAMGLLQVMPRTASEFGISNLYDPENGLNAGIQYLFWLLQRFEPELDIGERTWFALAAYNAGLGHVRDARRLASEKGLDPDTWFDNVEKAMLMLSNKAYANKAKHGYVRGYEPVNYVREIRDRYLAYLDLQEEKRLAQVE